MATADSYRWVRDRLPRAACVTVVRGLDVAGVVEALGGDPATGPEPLDHPPTAFGPAAAVGRVGDVVLAFELGGIQGCRPEVVRPASRNGLAVSVCWDEATASSRYAFAQEGEMVAAFEPSVERIPEAFVRMERATGVRLSLTDVAALSDLWRLVPVLDELRPAPPVRYHPLWRHDRGLVEAVAAAAPERQREIALSAAAQAAASAGLDREPGVQVVLATGRMTPEVAGLVRRTGTWAALAVYRATNPDPLAAALDALYAATRPSPPC